MKSSEDNFSLVIIEAAPSARGEWATSGHASAWRASPSLVGGRSGTRDTWSAPKPHV